jgi:hypothetical protein
MVPNFKNVHDFKKLLLRGEQKNVKLKINEKRKAKKNMKKWKEGKKNEIQQKKNKKEK